MSRRLVEIIAEVNAEMPIEEGNPKEVEQEKALAEGLAEADEEILDSTESKENPGKAPKRDLVERLLEVNRRIPFGGGGSEEVEEEKPAPIRGTITFVTKDSPLYQQMKPKK